MALTPFPVPEVKVAEVKEAYGRFVIEPLYKGFATTLGNSLRRVLLSSLPGAAVTWLKIASVSQEFSSIPHVKEDVIELMLNVKSLRLRPVSNRSGKLNLDVVGEGEISGADISSSADFEIANPELHIASLDSNEAKLAMELNVDLGRGYVPAGTSDNLDAGAIPVDAAFTPIRQVSFQVEETSTSDAQEHERLVLEVWTDNTISPEEAVTQAASILTNQLSPIRDFHKPVRGTKDELPLGLPIPAEQLNMPIDVLDLSTRSLNSLRRGGISTVGELLQKSIGGKALPSLRQFGEKAKEEVVEKLKSKLNIDVAALIGGAYKAEGSSPAGEIPDSTEKQEKG